MTKFFKQRDETITDSDGNTVFFSLHRFIEEICEGDACFLCGATKTSAVFNDEHIIPRWILKQFRLFNDSITLPNDEKIQYGKYTVPCCQGCNEFLGAHFESKISKAVEGGYEGVTSDIKNGGGWKYFLWLSLIFLKTHLKDSMLRQNLDRRKGNETIANEYEWGFLHHIHGMAAAVRNGVSIAPECLGTFFVLPAKIPAHYGHFDYRDIYLANTILLRIGDIAFFAVLDDSCAAANFLSNYLDRIDGPLSPIQCRELLSHLTLLNYKLKCRPQYHTKVDANTGEATIVATLPQKLEIEKHSAHEFGEILHGNVCEMIEAMSDDNLSANTENIKAGRFHFLFDDKGKFLKNCMELIEDRSRQES